MTIGEKIKQLRKQNDITQEKLAEYLNISYQAISKWENSSAMPDISLVIPLANFFGVSTDTLFDLDSQALEQDIKAYDEEGMRLANLGLVKERTTHWRKAVLKYPRNYHCMTQLAFALLGMSDAERFDEKRTKEYHEEAVSICERILSDCTDVESRSSAIQILVIIYGYGPLKNEDKAVEVAMKAPISYCSREILLLHAYSGDKKKKQEHEVNLICVDILCDNLIYSKYDSTEEYIFAYETALKIYQSLFYDENYLFFHLRIEAIHLGLAKFYADLQKKDKVIEHLNLAKNCAIKSDTIPNGDQNYTSIFLSMAIYNNDSTSKNYTCSNLGLIKEELKTKRYDCLRNDSDFVAFEKSL